MKYQFTYKRFLFYLGVFIIPLSTYALVQLRGNSGGFKGLHWGSDQRNLDIHVNPSNSQSISEGTIENIIDFSLSQWNGNGDIETTRRSWGDGASAERNDLYFSTDSDFGPSVLAITRLNYYSGTGRIFAADVIVNDNADFSENANAPGGDFLGDVLTHEFGHFMGFGHGQVQKSTMTYVAFRGQHILHSDDKEGLNALYPLSSKSRGTLKGVVGRAGSNRGVFGAYVKAVSSTSGKVIASAATEKDGSFNIKSLPINDTYYLYIAPLRKNAGPPSYYNSASFNFCNNGADWVESYSQRCGDEERGHPQGFRLSSDGEVLNVGAIGIRCEFEIPLDYSSGGSHSINLVQSNDQEGAYVGEVRTGFFSDTSINANSSLSVLNNQSRRVKDTYVVDLSDYNPDAEKDLFLDIKIVAQGVYSPLRTNVLVWKTPSGTLPSDGNFIGRYPNSWDSIDAIQTPNYISGTVMTDYNLDRSGNFIVRVPLDETQSDQNRFTIEIVPQPLTRGLPTGIYLSDLFPAASTFTPSKKHYLMILTVSEREEGNYYIVEEKAHRSCTEKLSVDGLGEDESDSDGASCGAIDPQNPNSGGGNFILMALMGILMALIELRKRKAQTFFA
ncbi:MAG: matrixin family metalloprotease [Bacteriovoracales bacterium]|nr:matrixin family metalloprotease [Bacteriovoracales bacterium]